MKRYPVHRLSGRSRGGENSPGGPGEMSYFIIRLVMFAVGLSIMAIWVDGYTVSASTHHRRYSGYHGRVDYACSRT